MMVVVVVDKNRSINTCNESAMVFSHFANVICMLIRNVQYWWHVAMEQLFKWTTRLENFELRDLIGGFKCFLVTPIQPGSHQSQNHSCLRLAFVPNRQASRF